MRVNAQEENAYYMSQGLTGTLQDKQQAYYAGGGAVADPTSRAQKIRVLTDTSGSYTWVFPTPYPAGVIPAIQLTVEDAGAGTVWNHKVVTTTNTQVVVQITKTTSVTVLSVSVLGIAANPQAYVHINAAYPSSP